MPNQCGMKLQSANFHRNIAIGLNILVTQASPRYFRCYTVYIADTSPITLSFSHLVTFICNRIKAIFLIKVWILSLVSNPLFVLFFCGLLDWIIRTRKARLQKGSQILTPTRPKHPKCSKIFLPTHEKSLWSNITKS